MSFPPSTTSHISSQLTTSLSLQPTTQWLQAFLSTQKPTTPLSSLLATARIRLLNSDLTTSTQTTPASNGAFPADIHNPDLKERRLPGPIVVQILGVEDLTRSRWDQIEAIEAAERGEGTKGREIVRVVSTDEDDGSGRGGGEGGGGGARRVNTAPIGGGCSKVLVQDARGVNAWGIELKTVQELGPGMNIGSKAVLRNVLVARGVMLLEPNTVTLLGGKIGVLHKAWTENRKAELRAAIEAETSTRH